MWCAAAQDFKSEVTVETLPELSANVFGTIAATNKNLWSGTPANVLLNTLLQIESAQLSPASRALVNHLLRLDVTGAAFNDSQNLMRNNRFFIARLKALEQQGAWDDVLQMTEKIPDSEMTAAIRQIKANVLLMKGQVKEACALQEEIAESLSGEEAQSPEAVYADKMLISCFLAKEEKDKAMLAYDMFQDAHPDADADFTALADNVLRELPVPINNNMVLSPAEVYLYSLVKNPALNWNRQTRAIKKTLADLPATDILLRIQLGEAIGLDLQELQKLYGLPLLNPPADNPVAQRVASYQKAVSASDMAEKVRAFSTWVKSVKQAGLFVTLAPLIADAAHQIPPDKKYMDTALTAVQAFALTNNLSAAEAWCDLLSGNDLYQKQYLEASLILQTLGHGLRDFEERLQYYCSYAPPADCSRLKRLTPLAGNTALPPSAALSLFQDNENALTTGLGNSLLQAVLNISEKKNMEKSYLFIQKAARLSDGRAILREGLVLE